MQSAIALVTVLALALSSGVLASAIWDWIRAQPERHRFLALMTAAVVFVGSASVGAGLLVLRLQHPIEVSARIQAFGSLPAAPDVSQFPNTGQLQVTTEVSTRDQSVDPSSLIQTIGFHCLQAPDGAPPQAHLNEVSIAVEATSPIGESVYWEIHIPAQATQSNFTVTIGPLIAQDDCTEFSASSFSTWVRGQRITDGERMVSNVANTGWVSSDH